MALGECQKMSDNVGIWLATTRQLSAPVGALWYTKFGDLSNLKRKLEGDLPSSASKLDQTIGSDRILTRPHTRTQGALVLGRALIKRSLGEIITNYKGGPCF